MKGNFLKSLVFVLVLGLAISVFALSGTILKPKGNDKSIKKDVITKEIVIDDIEKMNVPVYKYVEKVIIEGKWGTKPGEFGIIGTLEDPTAYSTDSLAVDSKGNIYILDTVNNRIQKFNKEGKYLLSISIPSFADSKGKSVAVVDKDIFDKELGRKIDIFRGYRTEPKILGVNIVIDSNDNLYYYMIRNKGTKNAQGEVWMFKNDKLVKKWKGLPKGYLYYDKTLDKIFIKQKKKIFDIINKNYLNISEYKNKVELINKKNMNTFEKITKEKINFIKKNDYNEIQIKSTNIVLKIKHKKGITIYSPMVSKDGNKIYLGVFQMYKGLYNIKIDMQGNIKGIYGTITRGYGLQFTDSKGNVYQIENDNDFKVLKYVLKRVK